jgi:hypothetical protein
VLPNSLECLLISDPDTDKVCYFDRARMDWTGFCRWVLEFGARFRGCELCLFCRRRRQWMFRWGTSATPMGWRGSHTSSVSVLFRLAASEAMDSLTV